MNKPLLCRGSRRDLGICRLRPSHSFRHFTPALALFSFILLWGNIKVRYCSTTYQINANHTFGPQQWRSFPSIGVQSEQSHSEQESLLLISFPWLSPLQREVSSSSTTVTQTGLAAGARASCSSAFRQGVQSATGKSQPARIPASASCAFAWFRFLFVWRCVFLFVCCCCCSKDRGCFHCNALICFASQTGCSSSFHMTVNAEELHRMNLSLIGVTRVNGYTTAKRVIRLALFAEQQVKKVLDLPSTRQTAKYRHRCLQEREMLLRSRDCLHNTFPYTGGRKDLIWMPM